MNRAEYEQEQNCAGQTEAEAQDCCFEDLYKKLCVWINNYRRDEKCQTPNREAEYLARNIIQMFEGKGAK